MRAKLAVCLLLATLVAGALAIAAEFERNSGSTAVAGTQVTVLSTRATPFKTVRFTLRNTGSNALTDVKVLAGPTAALATVDIDSSNDITNGLSASTQDDFVYTANAYGWLKLVCTADASNDTTVVGYVVAN